MFTLYRVAFGATLKSYPVYTVLTFHFGDWHSAALLQYRNRNKITIVICEQKPYPG